MCERAHAHFTCVSTASLTIGVCVCVCVCVCVFGVCWSVCVFVCVCVWSVCVFLVHQISLKDIQQQVVCVSVTQPLCVETGSPGMNLLVLRCQIISSFVVL